MRARCEAAQAARVSVHALRALTLRPAGRSAAVMASVDFTGVLELCKKGMGAQIRKRFARAAEYFGSAAESLQSLELPEDCLIHAVVGVHHASIFGYHAALPGVQSGAALLLVSRELSIVDAALPVLLRRRAACSLPCVGWTAEEHASAFAFGEFEFV